MRRIRPSLAVIALTMLVTLAWGAAAQPKYVHPQDIDWDSVLSGPPAENSAEHRQEIATLLHWQNKRTAEDIRRCKGEVVADPFIFAQVLGDWFNVRSLPITADLLDQAAIDTKSCVVAAKQKWNRPRPWQTSPQIHPCVYKEASSSYPSGHAAGGIVWATLLAEIFPDHRDQLMALGRQIGDDRVIGGAHWPSDVEAGQKLGAQIAGKLLDNADFKSELEHARDECLTVAH